VISARRVPLMANGLRLGLRVATVLAAALTGCVREVRIDYRVADPIADARRAMRDSGHFHLLAVKVGDSVIMPSDTTAFRERGYNVEVAPEGGVVFLALDPDPARRDWPSAQQVAYIERYNTALFALLDSNAMSARLPPAPQPIDVTAQHVGRIPLDSTLGYIAGMVPIAEQTSGQIEESEFPVWVFRLGEVEARAMQWHDAIDPNEKADGWLIQGRGITLAGHIPLPGTWGELHDRFPSASHLSIDELGAHVEICSLPGLTFFLDFPYNASDSDSLSAASIPRSALVGQVAVYPKDSSSSCRAA